LPNREDVIWGAKLGLVIGVMYTALAVLLYAFTGSGRFDKVGIPVGVLCLLYLVGGLVAGLVLGVFRSALDNRASAFVVGILAAMPISFGITGALSHGFSQWTMDEWIMVLVMSMILSAMGVSILWEAPEDPPAS
jgi:hypothetical protein